MTDFDDLLAKAEKATPGPWAWMGNNHDMYLATTHSGRRYVMGFRRMGTQSAQPVFNVNNRLVPASELVMFEVGDGAARGFKAGKADDSVYRYDIKGVDAPDAAYIAAASPDVIRALVLRLREVEEQYGERCAEYQRLDRNFDLLQERLREAEEALRPFQRVGWPSVSDPDDNEGDIPDFTEVDVVASGFDLNATDYMVDPLTVGDFRRAAAYFDTTEGGE